MLKLMGNVFDSASRQAQSEQAKVSRLRDMGFEESPALFALRRADGNVEQAVEILFAGAAAHTQRSAATTAQQPASSDLSVQEVMAIERRERAAQAALARNAPPRGSSESPSSSRAGNQSGLAPSKRAAPTLEAQFESLGKRLAQYPDAVDMIAYVLGTILNNPGEGKYRELKATKDRFKQTIGASGTAGSAYLELCGFRRSGDWYVLRSEDQARVWLAKSTLDVIISSNDTYRLQLDRKAFETALSDSIGTAKEEEEKRRAAFAPRVPVEPEPGRAGTTRITVFCGSDILQRRFNSDDIVHDIILWLGASHRSFIPDRLVADRSWELVDKTLYPPRVLELSERELGSTLHAARMWPSAELVVQPCGTLERQNRADGVAM